jgi:FkbM family methyltransferase
LVEPLPEAFAILEQRYRRRQGLSLVQAAIAEADGETTLYRPNLGAGLPPQAQHLASLHRDVLLSHERDYGGQLAAAIEAVPTVGMTFATLMERFPLPRLDALVIDAEGADAMILRQVDLARWRPRVIVFEVRHLQPADRAWAEESLRREGFRIHWTFQDAAATRFV